LTLGDFRHHGGRFAEENLRRSPVLSSARLSLTRGATTSAATESVSTPAARRNRCVPPACRPVRHRRPLEGWLGGTSATIRTAHSCSSNAWATSHQHIVS
jgi:hypothetical protein